MNDLGQFNLFAGSLCISEKNILMVLAGLMLATIDISANWVQTPSCLMFEGWLLRKMFFLLGNSR